MIFDLALLAAGAIIGAFGFMLWLAWGTKDVGPQDFQDFAESLAIKGSITQHPDLRRLQALCDELHAMLHKYYDDLSQDDRIEFDMSSKVWDTLRNL